MLPHMRNCCIFTYQAAILRSSPATGSKFQSTHFRTHSGSGKGNGSRRHMAMRHCVVLACSSCCGASACPVSVRSKLSPWPMLPWGKPGSCNVLPQYFVGVVGVDFALFFSPLFFFFGNVITSECGVSCLGCAAGLMTVFFCWLQKFFCLLEQRVKLARKLCAAAY